MNVQHYPKCTANLALATARLPRKPSLCCCINCSCTMQWLIELTTTCGFSPSSRLLLQRCLNLLYPVATITIKKPNIWDNYTMWVGPVLTVGQYCKNSHRTIIISMVSATETTHDIIMRRVLPIQHFHTLLSKILCSAIASIIYPEF